MALLKTYSIGSDITSGTVNTSRLHIAINSSGHVNGFKGITTRGDVLEIEGDKLSDESGLNAIVLSHSGLNPDKRLESTFKSLTTTERNSYSSIEDGVIIYDTTLQQHYKYTRSAWSPL